MSCWEIKLYGSTQWGKSAAAFSTPAGWILPSGTMKPSHQEGGFQLGFSLQSKYLQEWGIIISYLVLVDILEQ